VRADRTIPPDAKLAVVHHRVPFYETDAMGIVHHSNWVRYLELGRIRWLDEHDRPYRDWVAAGYHYTTTRVEIEYLRPASYDDVLEIRTWLGEVRGASLRMAYRVTRGGELLAAAAKEHALVDLEGRPRRIPSEHRARLVAAAPAARKPRS